jgi:hypothetical protein
LDANRAWQVRDHEQKKSGGSVNSGNLSNRVAGLTLRKAALVAGFAYLLNPVSYAEFSIYPKLVIAGSIEQTVRHGFNWCMQRSPSAACQTWWPFTTCCIRRIT